MARRPRYHRDVLFASSVTFSALALALVAAPTTSVSLAKDSVCAPKASLEREFPKLGLRLADDAALRIRLTPKDQGIELQVFRDEQVVLTRVLRGTCEESALAASVIVERYVRDLSASAQVTHRPPRIALPPLPPARDAGVTAPALRPPLRSSRDAGEVVPETPPVPPRIVPPPEATVQPVDAGTPTPPPPRPTTIEPAPPPPPRFVEPTFPADPSPLRVPSILLDAGSTLDAGLPTPPEATPEAPDASVPVAELVDDAGTPSPPGAEWSVLLGGGAIIPTPGTVSPWFSLEGNALLARRWQVGLLAATSLGGSTTVTDSTVSRGTLTTRDVLALPGLSVCTDTLIRACAGLLAGLRLTIGTASGTYVFQTKARVFPEFTGGLRFEATLPISWFRVSLGLGLLVNPVPTEFGLEGLTAKLTTPVIEGFAHLRIGFGSVVTSP